jgi:hypothetical protein
VDVECDLDVESNFGKRERNWLEERKKLEGEKMKSLGRWRSWWMRGREQRRK